MHARLQLNVIRGGKVDRWRADCARKVATARESIADLQAHFDSGRALTPSERAAYQHRLAQYARSGEPDLFPEPPKCA